MRTFSPLVPVDVCGPCSGSSVRVGAPPFTVEHGLPGAAGEIRAYAARIAHAWSVFLTMDVNPWILEKDKGAAEDTSGGTVPTPGGLTDDDIAMMKQIDTDHTKFEAYQNSLNEQSDSVFGFGSNASEVWQGLELHESLLKADRKAFAQHIGMKLKSEDPGALEEQGGIKQKSPFSTFADIPWTPILIVGGIAATGYLLSKASVFVPSHESAPAREHAAP